MKILLPILCLFGSTLSSHGLLLFTLQENGADVELTVSGSLTSLSGLTSAGVSAPILGLVNPSTVIIQTGTNLTGELFLPTVGSITGDVSFGTGTLLNTSINDGGSAIVGLDLTLGLGVGALILPSGYVAGTPITGGGTFTGQTLAGMGVTPGIYSWSWTGAGDSVQLNAISAIPEPSAYISGLGVVGLGAFVWMRRKRRVLAV
ncbi:hypothetical protein [Cerasicoccus frondis]|uniref:hypothetical protein n=1 Tax=Cerasicoccus frondis TaxID=490090 RepID=UPI002852DAAC|nr:hypothetical protein [Cerasicoccus frondis]